MKQQKKLYYQFAGSLCLLLFVFIGYVVKFYPQNAILHGFDFTLIKYIQGNITPALTQLFKSVTFLGSPTFDTLLSLVLFIVLFCKKRRLEAYYLGINIALIAGIGNQLLKLIFQRPRPDFLRLAQEGGFSFPSGHAMGSIIMYGTIFILICTFTRSQALRWVAGIACLILVALIGVSRVYLGVHYPSDIIGGWLVGGGYLLLTYPLYRHRRFIKEFKGDYR